MKHLLSYLDDSVCVGDAEQVANVREWVKWASEPRTEDEIREKCLTDFNNVCFTFLCEKSKMSCDFIEELMALSTGVLTKDNYDEMYDKVHALVLKDNGVNGITVEDWCIKESETHIKESELPNKSGKERYIQSNNIKDRINWRSICKYQRLTEEFMRKFNKSLVWQEVKLNQQLSKQFKEDFKDKLSCKSIKINHI